MTNKHLDFLSAVGPKLGSSAQKIPHKVSHQKDPEVIFAKVLKEAMTSQHMKVSDLARQSGVPVKTIYHWMAGQQPRKITHVCKVARVLKFTLEELFFGLQDAETKGSSMLPSPSPPVLETKENEVVLKIHISLI